MRVAGGAFVLMLGVALLSGALNGGIEPSDPRPLAEPASALAGAAGHQH